MDTEKKYKIDRIPHELLYVLSRVGLFILVDVFAVFMSIIFCSLISTVLGLAFDGSNRFVTLELVPFIISPETVSFVGWLILTGIMLRLFWDDGKRQTAYGRFSLPVAFGAVFFMFVIYFIPSIFIEKAKDTLASGIMGFYKPCLWLSEALGGSVKSPVVISAGLTAFLCLILYKLSGDRYLSKHPELADKI